VKPVYARATVLALGPSETPEHQEHPLTTPAETAALAAVTPSREPGDTVTLTRAALVDLLVTAASLGRNLPNAGTREDVAAYLGTYGLRVDSPRLDVTVAHAITSTVTA
jgi:hypothetical protein